MFKVIEIKSVDCWINAFVKYKRKYYVVSDNGYGCNIYRSDQKGEIVDWLELASIESAMLGDVVKDASHFSKFLAIK